MGGKKGLIDRNYLTEVVMTNIGSQACSVDNVEIYARYVLDEDTVLVDSDSGLGFLDNLRRLENGYVCILILLTIRQRSSLTSFPRCRKSCKISCVA